jgi:hypothetical protein
MTKFPNFSKLIKLKMAIDQEGMNNPKTFEENRPFPLPNFVNLAKFGNLVMPFSADGKF